MQHKSASPFPELTHDHKGAAQLCRQLFGWVYLACCFRMKAENWMSFLARDIPPLPKELFIWHMNLVLHDADSMEKKHWLHVPQECTPFVN